MAKQATKAEIARWEVIKQIGCLACRLEGWYTYPEIHHLVWFGKRRGHTFTVGLCCHHHHSHPIGTDSRKDCEKVYGPSLASNPRAFRARYAKDDDELLDIQNKMIDAYQKGNAE